MKRYLENYIKKDLKQKIVLVSGPRQVGKTTMSKQLLKNYEYLNFDSGSDRDILNTGEWNRDVELVIFDELHKKKNWKSWIKGIYDTEGINPSLLVTGSARLDTYKKGGESLAGRFFPFRLHPLTIKEICHSFNEEPVDALNNLLKFGGFPEPYLKKNDRFVKRWRRTHTDTIIREDLLDLERVRDIKSIEILIHMLKSRVGSTISYTSLSTDLQVSVHTVKHWLQILENLYIIFPVRPYSKNIARSILKQAKYYFYDTGAVDNDLGARMENTVACALLRELHFIEDINGTRVALHYLRDKEKREVDFLVVLDNTPYLMVEVKTGDTNFSPSLFRFKKFLQGVKAVQVVHNLTRKKTKNNTAMLPAHEFLLNLHLNQ
ncbi:MAG: ATP-binding protein [Desulfobacteraceae bacterium]|nr:ATP-binding protein [Desulfobacteraceae bacterium]